MSNTEKTDLEAIYDLVVRHNAHVEKEIDAEFLKELIGERVGAYNRIHQHTPLILNEDEDHLYSLKDHVEKIK